MTDDARAGLRRGVERLMRHAAAATAPVVRIDERGHFHRDRISVHLRDEARIVRVTEADPPPLATDKQLALNVLVGDPDTLADALADYMIERGFEYAAAVAEKARVEERERCAAAVRDLLRAEPLNQRLARVLAAITGDPEDTRRPHGPDPLPPT